MAIMNILFPFSSGHALLPLWTAQCWLMLGTLAMHGAAERARASGAAPDWQPFAELWGNIAEGLAVMAPLCPLLRAYEVHALTQQLDILAHELPSPMLVEPPEFAAVRASHDNLSACMLRLQYQLQHQTPGPLDSGFFSALIPVPSSAQQVPAAHPEEESTSHMPEAEVALRYLERVSSYVSVNMCQVAADYYSITLQPPRAMAAVTRAVSTVVRSLYPHFGQSSTLVADRYQRCHDGLPFAYHWRDACSLLKHIDCSELAVWSLSIVSNSVSEFPTPLPGCGILGYVTTLREHMRTVMLYYLLETRTTQEIDPSAPFEFDIATATDSTSKRIASVGKAINQCLLSRDMDNVRMLDLDFEKSVHLQQSDLKPELRIQQQKKKKSKSSGTPKMPAGGTEVSSSDTFSLVYVHAHVGLRGIEQQSGLSDNALTHLTRRQQCVAVPGSSVEVNAFILETSRGCAVKADLARRGAAFDTIIGQALTLHKKLCYAALYGTPGYIKDGCQDRR